MIFFTYFFPGQFLSCLRWIREKENDETDEVQLSPEFSLALNQIGPKIKLKTEIEQNENSIELLTLIFFLLLFTRSRANNRTICLSRADDGN